MSSSTPYRSLYSALKGWYCKPLAEYPAELRSWIEYGLGLGMTPQRVQTWWDSKSPAARIAYAKQWDCQHDPAFKARHEEIENFCNAYDRLARSVAEWEQAGTPTAIDLERRDEKLATLRPQLEVMALRHRKLLEARPDISAVANPENLADAARVEPDLIDRNEVIAKFRVKPNVDENEKFWDDKLGRPPRWLQPALGLRGKPGTSSLWKPLVIAHCLLAGVNNKPFVSLRQLDVMIHKGLPEWFEAWQEQTDHAR